MADPFLSEIRILSFNFAPQGWATCDGQLLPVNQNQALFSLLGTTYGGDGIATFALPNLQGRAAMHRSGGHALGARGGEQTHALSLSEIPPHGHVALASPQNANANIPSATTVLASPTANQTWAPGTGSLTAMDPSTLASAGSSQGHQNMQPYLVLNFSIALQGMYPPRN